MCVCSRADGCRECPTDREHADESENIKAKVYVVCASMCVCIYICITGSLYSHDLFISLSVKQKGSEI